MGPASDTYGSAPTSAGQAISGFALNNGSRLLASTFMVPKSGTITHIGFYVSAITGTPPAYEVSIKELDASGRPVTATAHYGGSTQAAFTPSGTGWTWVALAVAATAVRGDRVGVRVTGSGTAPDGSNNMTVLYAGGTYRPSRASRAMQPLHYDGSWIFSNYSVMAIKYDDGTIFGFPFTNNLSSLAVSATGTPDEVGGKFSVPHDTVVSAFIVALLANTGGLGLGTVTATLYDNNDTVIWSEVYDANFFFYTPTGGTAFYQQSVMVPDTAITLTGGATYRLTVKPNASNFNVPYMLLEDSAAFAQLRGTTDWCWTERTNDGAWTDQALGIAPIGLIASSMTVTTEAESGSAAPWGFVG